MFRLLDQDKDERISLEEVYSCNMKDMQAHIPGLVRTDSGSDHSEDEHNEL